MKLEASFSLALILLVSTTAALSIIPSTCYKNYTPYAHGDAVPDSDPCKTCECAHGQVMCAASMCILLNCADGSAPIKQPGECCASTCPPPTCLESETGVRHPVGPIDDGSNCAHCVCDPSGEIFCAHVMCAPPVCHPNVIPVMKPGDCCPSCPEVTCLDPETNIAHPVGPVDKNDSCLTCTCDTNGFLGCIRETCPLGPCPRAVTKPGECCATCTFGCDGNDGNFHEVGPVDDGNPCSTCECDIFGSIICQLQLCAPVTCPSGADPVQQPGECCPTCPATPPTCTDEEGNIHPVGKIETSNSCEYCQCDVSGQILCAMSGCAPLACPDPKVTEGQCCATCPAGCAWDGTWYEPGPIPSDNTCGPSCSCDGESGLVACSMVGCTPMACSGETYTPEGQCCPVCRE